MPYTPTGTFSTKHKMRLLLADCPTVQSVMEAANSTAAMAKIATYGIESDKEGTPQLPYPRILIHDEEVHLRTDEMGGLLGVMMRTIYVWIGFYVPPTVEGIDDVNDEEAWVLERFSNIVSECLARTGRGTSTPGLTQLHVTNPIFHGAQKEPDDERGDPRNDPHPEWPRWFGMVAWEVH